MRKILVTVVLALSPFFAYAQGAEGVQRSSSPLGMRVQGNNMQAGGGTEAPKSSPSASSAEGEGRASANTTSSAKSATQFQGNTTIKANARNVNSVASGRNNAAGNEVGAIGK
jgi:hypothetical protein